MMDDHLGHNDNGFVCAHIFAMSGYQKTNRLTNKLVAMMKIKGKLGAERSSELDGVTLEDGFGGREGEVELNFGETGRGVVN